MFLITWQISLYMNRRALIRSIPAIGFASVAGCLDRVPTVGETKLGWFGIYNFDEKSGHLFDVRIERDGNVVHESSHQVGAYQHDPSRDSPPNSVVSRTWEDVAGDYTVFVRSDKRDRNSYGILEGVVNPPACVMSYVTYGDNFGPGDNPPQFEFVIDEDECSEVRSLPGGCSAYE